MDRGIRVLVRRYASLDRRYRYSLLGDGALGDFKPEETARGVSVPLFEVQNQAVKVIRAIL